MFLEITLINNKLGDLYNLNTKFGEIDLENIGSELDGSLDEDGLNLWSNFFDSKLYSFHKLELE